MQVVFSGLRLPALRGVGSICFYEPEADEGVSGFDLPCGRAPAQTGNGPLLDKSDVLEMIADDLTKAEVMVLMDQRVVEWFEFCVSDRFEFNGSQIAQFIL